MSVASVIGDFPDVEKCVAALLRPIVADDNHIGNFVIADFDDVIEAGQGDTPHIEIHRRGGRPDMATFTDWPLVEVLCWGKSRSVAVGAARDVVRLLVLNNPDGHFMAGEGFFDSVEDVTGSEEISSENPDDRCVSMTFELSCRPMYD